MTIIGHENRIQMTIRGETAYAVRVDGIWRIEPERLAVSMRNVFGHLRDLRAAVRHANIKYRLESVSDALD